GALISLCSRGSTPARARSPARLRRASLRRLARAAGALFRGRVSVLRMGAADELAQELVALIGQLAVDADLGGVVAADRRVFRGHEEFLQRRDGSALVLADVGQKSSRLRRRDAIDRRLEPAAAFLIERRQACGPFPL